MNAPYIISQAIQLVAQGAKHPTISKLVGFLGTDEGETLMALRGSARPCSAGIRPDCLG